MGKVILQKKVGKVSKFQERLFNDNFKAGNGEERKAFSPSQFEGGLLERWNLVN